MRPTSHPASARLGMRRARFLSPLLLAALGLFAAACSDDAQHGLVTGREPGATGSFESDLPTLSGGARNAGAAPEAAADSAGTGANAAAAQRAIVEADVVQVAGTKLYALSRSAGLSVIDIAEPTQLALLGKFDLVSGEPFEMYLRGDTVIAMYRGWGGYESLGNDGGYAYVQRSRIVAIDARDPGNMALVSSTDVAGTLSDSRIVGDVLYAVSFEDGYCWNCSANQPRTTVTALSVKDATAPVQTDVLAFDESSSYGGWQRSITVTDQRIYVAGPEYGQNGPVGSTIQVVDIRDASGKLALGPAVKVAGQINSRWQMDEHAGVLRVVSQNATWSASTRPAVQTFDVSGASLTPVGRTDLVIPAGDTLVSARFDGARAYAVTARQTDPLIAIDLSDPAHPRQGGEVHMPGRVVHMQPLGDRLLGLGFDQGNPAGSITVSLFDVHAVDAPSLIARVNFGGTWGSLPEDQDRLQKVFRVLEDAGLLLVPYSGYDDGSASDPNREKLCVSAYQSGVQLVDFSRDTLTLQGAAPARGEARRALLEGNTLLSVTDSAISAFDIRHRDAPAALSSVSVAQNVTRVIPVGGGRVARVAIDDGSSAPRIDVVAAGDVGHPERSLGSFDLAAAFAADGCAPTTYVQAVLSEGSTLHVVYERYDYAGRDSWDNLRGVLSVDVSDPAAIHELGRHETVFNASSGSTWWSSSLWTALGTGTPGQTFALASGHLAMVEQSYDVSGSTRSRLRVVDLRDPAAPEEALLDLGTKQVTGLVSDAGQLWLGYYEQASRTRVRFYAQPIAGLDGGTVSLGDAVNVPGAPMYADTAHARLLTSELARVRVSDVTYGDCAARFAYYEFDYPENRGSASSGSASGSAMPPDAPSVDAGVDVPSDDAGSAPTPTPEPAPEPLGTCTGYRQSLQLVKLGAQATLEDSYTLPENQVVEASSQGDDRVVATLTNQASPYGLRGGLAIADVACFAGCYGGSGVTVDEPVSVLALSGFAAGELSAGTLSVDATRSRGWWWGFWGAPTIYAHGTHALLASEQEVAVLDLGDVTAPSVSRTSAMPGSALDVTFDGSMAFVALGQHGATSVTLE